MSRKSIFEILADKNEIELDAMRIEGLFDSEKLLIENPDKRNKETYTLKDFVLYFCFDDWKNRGHCVDLDDFLEVVNYDEYCGGAQEGDIDAFLVFSEIVLNCWKMAEIYVNANENITYYTNFYHLHDIIIDCLSQYNHTAVYNESTEQMLVIEDNPATTAVAEMVEPKLSLAVLKYNHHALRGDVDKKKEILLALGAELEAKRKSLHEINGTLEDNVFFMLNNLNLRHNNLNPTDKNYRKVIAEMDSQTLENWYDELYQMILLAFLEIDQIDRNAKVKDLKANINGGKQ